jgi:hypothetical protein
MMPLILALMLASPAHAQVAATAPAAEELTRLLTEFLDGASRNDVAMHDRFLAALSSNAKASGGSWRGSPPGYPNRRGELEQSERAVTVSRPPELRAARGGRPATASSG